MTLRAIARDFALSLPVAATVVASLGIARLTHQFPAAASSPGLLVPFVLPVLALALEAGALIALSVALLSWFCRARADVLPPAARARASLLLFGLTALILALAELIPRGTEHPGAFANELVQRAQRSCGESGRVAVPLLGLSVRCDPSRRIEGPMPGAHGVQLAMDELTFSDDLRRVEIRALELTATRSLRVRLRAGRARVSGLAPWSRSPRLSSLSRFATLLTLGGVLWLSTSLLLRRGRAVSGQAPPPAAGEGVWRLVGYGLFAMPGAVVAGLVISLDQARAAPTAYTSAALVGALMLGLVAVLVPRAPRIFGSFRAF